MKCWLRPGVTTRVVTLLSKQWRPRDGLDRDQSLLSRQPAAARQPDIEPAADRGLQLNETFILTAQPKLYSWAVAALLRVRGLPVCWSAAGTAGRHAPAGRIF